MSERTAGTATVSLERTDQKQYLPRHARPDDARPTEPDRDLALNEPVRQQQSAPVANQCTATPRRTVLSRFGGPRGGRERPAETPADAPAETGEVAADVAAILADLGPRWRVLHAVPLGYGVLDHVAIGPAGVFTVGVQRYPGARVWVRGETFNVNGLNHRHVRNCRYNATRAAQLLHVAAKSDVAVRAIVVVDGTVQVLEQPRDGVVVVLSAQELSTHLRGLPDTLDDGAIEKIFAAARHLSTWQPDTVCAGEF